MLFGGQMKKATGGNSITNVNSYTVHTFSSSGTYTATSTGFVDILLIGGGGNAANPGGYFSWGGSGGAGASQLSKFVKLPAGSQYTVTVAGPGGTTSFGSISSAAGGGGGAYGNGFPSPLASGGGGSTWGPPGVPGGTGAGVYGIGFPAFLGKCNSYSIGGGGGGAGSGGPVTTIPARGHGTGGDGIPISYFTGNPADVVCWGGGLGVPSTWGSGGRAQPDGTSPSLTFGQPGIAFVRYI